MFCSQCHHGIQVSISEVARMHSIPKTTLWKRLMGRVIRKGHRSGGRGKPRVLSAGNFFFFIYLIFLLHATPKQQIRNSTQLNVTFNLDDEADLAELLISFCCSGFPLSRGKIRQITWQYAEENQIKGFSHQKRKAGQKWLKGFLYRHKNLRPKKSKNISVNRAMCANPATVNNFFDHYKKVWNSRGHGDKLQNSRCMTKSAGTVVCVLLCNIWNSVIFFCVTSNV